MVNFRKRIWLDVSDSNGSVGLVHPLVIAFIALLVVGHIALAAAGGTAALGETNIALASLGAVFLQDGVLGLFATVLAFVVAGSVIVERAGNVALLVIVALALALNVGWHLAFPAALIIGFPCALMWGYATGRWPTLKVGGWLADMEVPLWAGTLMAALFSGAVLLIEHNGGPAEGHAHAAPLLALGVGVLLGGAHRLVTRLATRTSVA